MLKRSRWIPRFSIWYMAIGVTLLCLWFGLFGQEYKYRPNANGWHLGCRGRIGMVTVETRRSAWPGQPTYTSRTIRLHIYYPRTGIELTLHNYYPNWPR